MSFTSDKSWRVARLMNEKNISEKEAIDKYDKLSLPEDNSFDTLNMACNDDQIDIEPHFLHGTINKPYQKPDYLDLENDYLWSEYDTYHDRKYWEDKMFKEIHDEEFEEMEDKIEKDVVNVSVDNIIMNFEECFNNKQYMFAYPYMHEMLDDVTNHKLKRWYRLTPTQKLSIKIMKQDLMINVLLQHVIDLETKFDNLTNVKRSFQVNDSLFTHPKQKEMEFKHTVNQLHKELFKNKRVLSKFTKYGDDMKWLHRRNNKASRTSLE